MGNHEWCFYGWREGAAHRFYGPNNAVDVWPVKKVNPQSMVHLTEKPVELARRAMEYSSKHGEHVLDLFGGSGSTLIAAEQTGVSQRTVYRRLADPAFQQQLTATLADMVKRTMQMLTAAGLEAVKTLLDLQKPSTAASVRLGAARAVLEVGPRLREQVHFAE